MRCDPVYARENFGFKFWGHCHSPIIHPNNLGKKKQDMRRPTFVWHSVEQNNIKETSHQLFNFKHVTWKGGPIATKSGRPIRQKCIAAVPVPCAVRLWTNRSFGHSVWLLMFLRFLLLARYVPNVAKEELWDQCKKYEYWRPTDQPTNDQRPTSGPIHTFWENFKWP